jgi:hypothetical protein
MTVAKKLEETNLQITTVNGAENSPVGTANCSTMQHGLDICVDPEKPTQQADLNSKSVSYLHFKKEDYVKLLHLQILRLLSDIVTLLMQRLIFHTRLIVLPLCCR